MPSRDALELYVAASRLLDWVACGGWTLLQIDNSTSPTEDEIRVFERLVYSAQGQWEMRSQRSFLFDEGETDRTALVLLAFFALLFEWHVYLTSQHATQGQRLALQDGIVYFFGEPNAIESADGLVNQLAKSPLHLG